MSVVSRIRRRPGVTAAGLVFAFVEAFAINRLTSTPTWWWWVIAIASLVGVVGCTLIVEKSRDDAEGDTNGSPINGSVAGGGSNTQQSATGGGINVVADHGSFAANHVENVRDINIGATEDADNEPDEGGRVGNDDRHSG